MSFLNTEYTRRAIVGKTISGVANEDNGITKIKFTDGSFIVVYPHTKVTHTGNSVSWKPKIIVSAYDMNGKIIPAKSFEEDLTEVGKEANDG